MEGKLEKKGSLSDVKTEKRVYPVDESQYRLLEEVGRGASAVVYRAECIPFNEYVAIKSLDLERCNSNLNDIHREAKTMSLINHPNVVKAYCSFVVDHSLWVVMPYMAGGSCLHIMKSAYPDGFEEPIIASFLKETLKALDYLHTQGHIHRDVKAGNILVDGSGAVKLGDFGVSACMFDTGDRQRARNTFVGTPCWMAPEVMEQIHGYDFKADIWSFGITALELAHGHAPFSKFPPMKVLLMTLQNPPPGLDYARDRRFSKSFKEMIAMCLVKDPAKRPTAEKLLKHSFFKSARSAEYVARTILSPLPPLWERVNDLKIKDADRLAQKKMPYGEQEERSQNEYKRGVSAWNFDLEDLKAQAALGDGEPFSGMAEKLDSDFQEAIEALSPTLCFEHEPDVLLHSTKICSIKSEAALDSGEQSMHGLSGPLQVNGLSGRFDVFEDDPDQDSTDSPNSKLLRRETKEDTVEETNFNGNVETEMEDDNLDIEKGRKMELISNDARVHDQDHCSGLLIGNPVADSANEMREADSEIGTNTQALDESMRSPKLKEKPFNGPLASATTTVDANLSSNGLNQSKASIAQKDEEKLKGPLVQKKGRFSVTSHELESQEGSQATNTRRNASAQTSALHKSSSVNEGLLERKNVQVPTLGPSQSFSGLSSGMNAVSVIPQLQNLFNQTAIQQELIMNLMSTINPSGDQYVEKYNCMSIEVILYRSAKKTLLHRLQI
ncbi:hypothetical protein KP509_31G052000 [Ceratopteris richardii]|uniref:Protein kinase domain-containing protein n=1 Tax=Ceratopteris richardii TaxID=49495 RepID=A0A8T2QZF9_CERRI|nr:hypothetical protein KP509_31G052000 [Ceratopteris richardii]